MKSQEEINDEIHNALYGSEGEVGLIEKMDDVWEVLSAFRMFGKAVMWIAIVLGSVGTAWMAFGGVLKRIFFTK